MPALRQPTRRVRQAATPAPTPPPPASTPDPTADFVGAALTFCHTDATDVKSIDETDYIAVTVDGGKTSEHYNHSNDIRPAPAGGCASINDPDAAARKPLYVCHATGDPEQPYAILGPIARDRVSDHGGHKGDIIPAPRGTCPGLRAYAVPTPSPVPTPYAVATTVATTVAVPAHTATPDDERPAQVLLPAAAGAAAPGVTPVTVAEQLPFTGFDLWVIAAAGFGMALAGVGLRLLADAPSRPLA